MPPAPPSPTAFSILDIGLPIDSVLVIHETVIAEDQRSSAAGLLASLNMLLWTTGGLDFTAPRAWNGGGKRASAICRCSRSRPGSR